MSGPKSAGLKEFYCIIYHTTQHNTEDDYNLDFMRRQQRREGSEQMTKRNTKDEMRGGKIQIQNSTEKTGHIQGEHLGEDTEILIMFSPQDQPS
jgi:hypothetical protein